MSTRPDKQTEAVSDLSKPHRGMSGKLPGAGAFDDSNEIFKSQWIKPSKLARHVLALANSGGGAIVFGVKEKQNKTLEARGLVRFMDSPSLQGKLAKYLPESVQWELARFSVASGPNPTSKLKFQVMHVRYVKNILPVVALGESSGLRNDVIYVRRNSKSKPADHDELQAVINARIKSWKVPVSSVALSEHLNELKVLYNQLQVIPSDCKDTDGENTSGIARVRLPRSSFNRFIKACIEIKKGEIRKTLGPSEE